jgi:hypothetical protein
MDPMLRNFLVWATLLALSLAIGTRLRHLWKFRQPTADGHPRCLRCYYIIHPRSGKICPECGADLRTVGVLTPDTIPPVYPLASIIGGGVLLFVPIALLSFFVLAERIPFFTNYRATTNIPTHIPATQPGKADSYIQVTAVGNRHLFNQQPSAIGLTWWTHDADFTHWRVDGEVIPETGMCRWEVEADRHSQSYLFGEPAALHFIELAGIDPATPSAKALARDIQAQVEKFTRAEFSSGPVIEDNGYAHPPVQYILSTWNGLVITALIWLPTWLWTSRTLRARYDRGLAQAARASQKILDNLQIPP